MVIGRLISPVHSLGPGERVCLWTQGCSKRCTGCISPDLQTANGTIIDNKKLSQILIQVADNCSCSGLTVSGGDPFEQSDDLLEVLKLVRDRFNDILVYTGYTIEEILNGNAGDASIECLDYIDVLIDGRYEKKLNTPDCVLRGSANQIIHYLNKEKTVAYIEYMKKGRVIETFIHDDKTIITGILNEEENQ